MILEGVVVRGEGLGRKLGFPTANLAWQGEAPQRGVWAVRVEGAAERPLEAVCNVGLRPTVSSSGRLSVEVHIPGFSADLYGRRLRLTFLRKIREERAFRSPAELAAQIAADIEAL
ncbi:MAG: riboflavin kinase [Elusimicrobia bacterium]|nr:riboflavin kinase [Elusimicrobiota bacterium]MDE2236674.1 riboflavin kinase [Elusimicrobiota bacterium]MDE2425469.1 riboflavin kinase [Elusimicrobiota bacterium]